MPDKTIIAWKHTAIYIFKQNLTTAWHQAVQGWYRTWNLIKKPLTRAYMIIIPE